MRKIYFYSVWDREANQFDTPFFAVSDLFAIRRFHLMVEQNEILSNWPEQFDLWRIASTEMEKDPLKNKGIIEENIKYIKSAKQVKGVENEVSNGT